MGEGKLVNSDSASLCMPWCARRRIQLQDYNIGKRLGLSSSSSRNTAWFRLKHPENQDSVQSPQCHIRPLLYYHRHTPACAVYHLTVLAGWLWQQKPPQWMADSLKWLDRLSTQHCWVTALLCDCTRQSHLFIAQQTHTHTHITTHHKEVCLWSLTCRVNS